MHRRLVKGKLKTTMVLLDLYGAAKDELTAAEERSSMKALLRQVIRPVTTKLKGKKRQDMCISRR